MVRMSCNVNEDDRQVERMPHDKVSDATAPQAQDNHRACPRRSVGVQIWFIFALYRHPSGTSIMVSTFRCGVSD